MDSRWATEETLTLLREPRAEGSALLPILEDQGEETAIPR